MGALQTAAHKPPYFTAETQHVGQTISAAARMRLLSIRGEPLFLADWLRTLMIHYEVDPALLQRIVPFALDLNCGRAFVSIVAFTLNAMRPRVGGRFAAWLMIPISTHHFLNVRSYVSVNGEPGIYFMSEWLSNRLSVFLGPRAFGLPYRFAKIVSCHEWDHPSERGPLGTASIRGQVIDATSNGAFAYHAILPGDHNFCECETGSLSKWLMERYTAFTHVGSSRRFFRVWHEPWSQASVDISILSKSLLDENWPLFRDARVVGANFSPGVSDVLMGWPHRVPN